MTGSGRSDSLVKVITLRRYLVFLHLECPVLSGMGRDICSKDRTLKLMILESALLQNAVCREHRDSDGIKETGK